MKLVVRRTSNDPLATRETLGEMATRASGAPALCWGTTTVRLGKETAEAILDLVRAAARGEDVAIVPIDRWLTTQEAADLLGISRQHLARQLDAGVLPVTSVRTGKHRRLRLIDVLKLREARGLHTEPPEELTQAEATTADDPLVRAG